MNKEWSELNKTMQLQIKKKETFDNGIKTLFLLRKSMMKEILEFRENLSKDEFCAMPFPGAKGYHSKTIAYSLYHLFRIEDIVAHSLIEKTSQIFFTGNYKTRMNSPLITTGNELQNSEITEFSSKLNLDELYNYVIEVDASTSRLLHQLTYKDMAVKMTEQDSKTLHSMKVVSEKEVAVWLIDYWCGKNIRGLIQMPFSRHWIMHIQASQRIKDKIVAKRLI